MWSDENPSSGYPDTQASFGSISLVAEKLASLSKVSSSLEEDAPGLLLAHPVGTRVLVLKHLSADKRVVEGEAFAKPRSGMPSRPLPPLAVPATRGRSVCRMGSHAPRRPHDRLSLSGDCQGHARPKAWVSDRRGSDRGTCTREAWVGSRIGAGRLTPA